MRFNVRYIARGGNQPVQTVMNGADERAVGWAIVQRGDQLLSIEPADRPQSGSRPALAPARRAASVTPPARPASAAVVYSIVAVLLLVGIALPLNNLGWLYEADATADASAADLNRVKAKLAEAREMGLYRSRYDTPYVQPRERALADARNEMLPPLAWCACGASMLAVALLVSYRYHVGVRRWSEWQRGHGYNTSVERG